MSGRFVALALGGIAFLIAFAYPTISGAPVPWFYPLTNEWELVGKPHGLAMDFYGRLLWAAIAYAVVATPLWLWLRDREVRIASLVAGWLLTALVLIAIFYAWTLHYRVPVPYLPKP